MAENDIIMLFSPQRVHLQVFDVEGLKEHSDALRSPKVAVELHQQQHELSVGPIRPGVLQHEYSLPQVAHIICVGIQSHEILC